MLSDDDEKENMSPDEMPATVVIDAFGKMFEEAVRDIVTHILKIYHKITHRKEDMIANNLTYCLAYNNGGWVPGISRGLHCDQLAPKWTTPLLANPRNPAMSPTRPGTHHTDLVSGEKKINK